MTARGVVEANSVCATTARALARTDKTSAITLAKACTRASDTAFESLQAGENALDAMDQKTALCAISSGLEALRSVVGATKAAMGDSVVPKAIDDAMNVGSALASLVAGQCEVKP